MATDRVGRCPDVQLAHQKRKALLQRRTYRVPGGGIERPQLLLEGPDGLLAALVQELLFGVRRLTLLGGMLARPGVHLVLQRFRERWVLVDHVLEVGGEVNLAGTGFRERVEGIRRQRGGSMLDCATEAILLTSGGGELLERHEIER